MTWASRGRFLFGLFAAGCASKGGSPPANAADAQADAADAQASSCTTSDACDPSDCVCGDGSARQVGGSTCSPGTCLAPAAACAPVCAQNGGVRSSTPAPDVVGTPACNAFCAKALSLACPQGTSCRPYFNCNVPAGECAASVTAELGCQLEAGTWSCDPFGDWVVSSHCMGMFAAMCGDGGP